MKKRKKAIERLQAFTPFEINAVKDHLQPEVYALHKIVDARKTLLTTPVEVKHFELFKPEVIIEALFTDTSKEEIEKRINELELPVLQKLLPHLSTELLLCIKSERLNVLNLSTLTEKQKAIFTAEDTPSTSAVTAMRKKLFGDGKVPPTPSKTTDTPVKKDETITFTYFGKTLLIGKKIYDFAIDFIKTVWKGVRVVFAYTTFPIWKPYQLLQPKSISKGAPDIPPPPPPPF